jgi:hypothetical protein
MLLIVTRACQHRQELQDSRQAVLLDLPTLPASRDGLGHGPGHRDHHRLQSPPPDHTLDMVVILRGVV